MAKKYDYIGTRPQHIYRERPTSKAGWWFVIGFILLVVIVGANGG